MNTHKKIGLIAGMLLMGTIATVLAQIPGMPYIPSVNGFITLGQNMKYMLASIYDTDYLPYTIPTAVAATGAKAADGTAESTVINVQGSIPTTGVTVYIPATTTGGGTLAAYSTTITVPATMTEDGISRNLTLSWTAQPYTSSTTYITATLATVGGTLNAKKLDINGGVGNDYQGISLGAFSYPYNNAGNTTTFSVRNIAGIPDKMFGKYDIGNTTTYEHNFIYMPVVGEDGKIWLNNNLGADYANVSSTSFNPGQQATAYNDYHAYGSHFQWGRCPDGHELMNWTGSIAGTQKYQAINGQSASDAPTSANFLYGYVDWRNPNNNNLWQGENGTNNPCPSGFRVPTIEDYRVLTTNAKITNYTDAVGSQLAFTVAGMISGSYESASFQNVGNEGFYFTSFNNDDLSSGFNFFIDGIIFPLFMHKAAAYSVRCIGN